MLNANKDIVLSYYAEIMNRANREINDRLIAQDFVFINPTHKDPLTGPDGFFWLVSMLHSAFPDINFKVEDLIAEEDKVVSYWRCSGTHKGVLDTVVGKITGTGRKFEITGMSRILLRDGQIREIRVCEDALGLLVQLGAIPT
jgi:steroid delta-isomerase-like uncharacterized protein